jgi:TonB family protein
MRRLYTIIIIIYSVSIYSVYVHAQSKDSIPKLYIYVEHLPSANYDINHFLAEHIVYPPTAVDSSIEGSVKIDYIINALGHVDSVKVVKSVHPLLDSEAVRVIRIMPDWIPGKINGLPKQITHFTMPVLFRLGKDKISNTIPDSTEIKRRLAVKDSTAKNHGPDLAILNNWESYLRYHLRCPKEAKKQHITGQVRVRFLVEPTGEVSKYEIEDSSLQIFNDEALRLSAKIARMDWQPGVKNNQPIRYYLVLPFIFEI